MEDPTRLLQRSAQGDLDAYNALFTRLLKDMEAIAKSLMRHESRQITLDEGVLLSECYLRLRTLFEHRASAERPPEPEEWQSREQFLRFAARCMRSILSDAARRRGALKRGSHAGPVPIAEAVVSVHTSDGEVLFWDEAIERLSAVDPIYGELLQIVRFGGLHPREAGRTLNLSRKRFESAWTYVKAWVMRESGHVLPPAGEQDRGGGDDDPSVEDNPSHEPIC